MVRNESLPKNECKSKKINNFNVENLVNPACVGGSIRVGGSVRVVDSVGAGRRAILPR